MPRRCGENFKTAAFPDRPPVHFAPRQLAWRLVQTPHSLDAAATAALARISQDPEVAQRSRLGPPLCSTERTLRRAIGCGVL